MYLSLLLEKKLLHFSTPPSMNCSQNSCAQIHLSERKHPVQFGLFILRIFFFCVEYEDSGGQSLQL